MTATTLNQRLESLGNKVMARDSDKIHHFPLWSELQRGIPNGFARSALFAGTNGKDRAYLSNHQIFAQNGIELTYTGIRLTQAHLDVFESIMHLARETPENSVIYFSAHGLLKLLGRATGKTDHERLLRTLAELTATAVKIKQEGYGTYCGSLLPEWSNRDDNGKFSLRINRDLIRLFDGGFTLLEWEQRKKLGRKPLAQALHVWLCSHDKPYPVTVQYLHDITGSQIKAMKCFRHSLKVALDELKTVGVLLGWHIDETDKVHFVKA